MPWGRDALESVTKGESWKLILSRSHFILEFKTIKDIERIVQMWITVRQKQSPFSYKHALNYMHTVWCVLFLRQQWRTPIKWQENVWDTAKKTPTLPQKTNQPPKKQNQVFLIILNKYPCNRAKNFLVLFVFFFLNKKGRKPLRGKCHKRISMSCPNS